MGAVKKGGHFVRVVAHQHVHRGPRQRACRNHRHRLHRKLLGIQHGAPLQHAVQHAPPAAACDVVVARHHRHASVLPDS